MKFLLIVFFLFTVTKGSAVEEFARDSVEISGYIAPEQSGGNEYYKDSIFLYVWDCFYPNPLKTNIPHNRYVHRWPNPLSSFHFKIPVPGRPVYFSLQSFHHEDSSIVKVMSFYIMEPGDSISIVHFGNTNMSFYGKGSEKYTLRRELELKTLFIDYEEYTCPDTAGQMTLFNRFRGKLSASVSAMMLGDIVSEKLKREFYGQVKPFGNAFSRVPNDQEGKPAAEGKALSGPMRAAFIKIFEKPVRYPVSAQYAHLSRRLMDYVFIRERVISMFLNRNTEAIFDHIKERYSGAVRDVLMLGYFSEEGLEGKRVDQQLKMAISSSSSPWARNELTRILETQAVGSLVKPFCLKDRKHEDVCLSQFKGKLVVLDFWFTGCMACRTFYRDVLAPTEKYFNANENVVFITINIDKDRNQWIASLDDTKYVYTSDSVINLHSGGGVESPVVQDYNVLGYPTPILIGTDGRLITRSSQDLYLSPEKMIEVIEKSLKR